MKALTDPNVRNCDADPETFYNEVLTPANAYVSTDIWVLPGSQSIDLGNKSATNLESQLADDRFDIGMFGNAAFVAIPANGFLYYYFYGAGTSSPPRITVVYALP